MGDYFGDGPGGNPRRRRRFGDGYRDSGDSIQGWGMADAEDFYDGDFADIGDYAGGMVDEEREAGVGYRDRGFLDETYDESGYRRRRFYRKEAPFDKSSRHPNAPGESDYSRAMNAIPVQQRPQVRMQDEPHPRSRLREASPPRRRRTSQSRRPARRPASPGFSLENRSTQLLLMAMAGFLILACTCAMIIFLLSIS